MTMPMGTEVYTADSRTVRASGRSFSDEELTEALHGRVREILFDTEGETQLQSILQGIATTDFRTDALQSVLSTSITPQDWQVGEALADAYLTDHNACYFPWPVRRDLKNPKASPSGADILGFHTQEATRFAFGEAKTSADTRVPPHVMYSRTGLIGQLEDLRDSMEKKAALVRYLAFRAKGAPWWDLFQEAAAAFLRDPTDISLFGVLVRDTEPDRRDISARSRALARNCPKKSAVRLDALYLPGGCIPSLPARLQSGDEGDTL